MQCQPLAAKLFLKQRVQHDRACPGIFQTFDVRHRFGQR
jgi:hypothetical protein